MSRNGYHFGVFEYEDTQVPGKNIVVTRRVIVIKDERGLIVPGSASGLELYAVPYLGPGRLLKKPASKQELGFITRALNFWVDVYGIKSLRDITMPMVVRFFDSYAATPKKQDDEDYVKQETLDKCIRIVSFFLANVSERDGEMEICPEDLLTPVLMVDNHHPRRKQRSAFVPTIQKKAIPAKSSRIVRELPQAAINLLLRIIKVRDPMIFFACILMRYAGLRAGEAMNVRQVNSPLSKAHGFNVQISGNRLIAIEIDLTREFRMRSDNVSVGKIKRKTTHKTKVYPSNMEIVYSAYLDHLDLLSAEKVETEYMPMFVCRNGKAMTVHCFAERFRKIVKNDFIPALLYDPEMEYYGRLLQECGFGAHIFRHLFTVQVALETGNVSDVQEYRGDRSPESAMAYLMGKSEITRALQEKHEYVLNK